MEEDKSYYPTSEDYRGEDQSKEYTERAVMAAISNGLDVLKAEKDFQKRQEIQEVILNNYPLDLILETIEEDIESSLKKVEGDEEKTKEVQGDLLDCFGVFLDKGLGIGESNRENINKDLVLTSTNCASRLGDLAKTLEGCCILGDKISSEKDLGLITSYLARVTNEDFANVLKKLIIIYQGEELGISIQDTEEMVDKELSESLKNDKDLQEKLVKELLQDKYKEAQDFSGFILVELVKNDFLDKKLFQELISTLKDPQQKEFHKDIVDILVFSKSPKKLNLLLEMVQNQEISSPQLSLKILERFIDYYLEKPEELKKILNERNLNLETLILDNLKAIFSSDEIYKFIGDSNSPYQIGEFLEFLNNFGNKEGQKKIKEIYEIFREFFQNRELLDRLWNEKDAEGHSKYRYSIERIISELLNHAPELFIDILSEIPADSFLLDYQLYDYSFIHSKLIEKCLEFKNNSAIKVLEKILIHKFNKFKKSYEAKKQGADVYVREPLDHSYFPSQLEQIKEILKFLIVSKDDETKKSYSRRIYK